jgi:peroxiredoxin
MKNLFALAVLLLLALNITAQKTAPAATGPQFAALTMDGQKVDTAALRGKVIVINLWFVNCPNCIDEIKLLNALVDQYKGNNDVVFLGLAASSKPDLEKFLAKNPFKYQVVPNAQMIILTKFGTPDKNGDINVPFPMHYVLDRDGNVVVKAQGVKGIEPMRAALAAELSKKTGINTHP